LINFIVSKKIRLDVEIDTTKSNSNNERDLNPNTAARGVYIAIS
jgi:hypothetical protein